LEEHPDRETIERAEDLILRLRDVQSCKIHTDETGRISEIHVVAASDRHPKMIARDVETCLKAELGLWIDYRKIGVVLIDIKKETDPVKRKRMEDADAVVDRIFQAGSTEETKRTGPGTGFKPSSADSGKYAGDPAGRGAGGQAGGSSAADDGKDDPESTVQGTDWKAVERGGAEQPRLDFLEQDVRVRFKGLSLSLDEERVDVEVRLEKSGLEVTGCKGDIRKSGPLYEVIAGAAIHALTELLDEKFHLCLSGIEEVKVLGQDALFAVVDQVDGRVVRRFMGCVCVGRDPNEAAVLTVLDAVNRAFGRWKSRKEVHYRIR
jgi:hypothetical protein